MCNFILFSKIQTYSEYPILYSVKLNLAALPIPEL